MNTLIMFIIRFAAGLPLDGHRRTDASPFHRGEPLHGARRASKWARLRHVERAGIRWTVVALCVGLATDATLTLALLAVAATAGAWVLWRKLLNWSHMRRTVRPYASALSVQIEDKSGTVAKTLAVPRKITQESRIVAPLPAHFQHGAGQMAAIERITGHRLGHEWTAQSHRELPAGVKVPRVEGRRASAYPGPWLVLSRKAYPPASLEFGEVADLIRAKGGPEKILAGLTTGREPVWLNFESALAHLALSVGTGGGKSSFLRLIIAQFSYWGAADFPVIDSKFISLEGMESLPGLRVYREPQEQWDELERLSGQMDRRYRERLANRHATFPLCVVLLEEQNDAAIEWREHWKDHPDRERRSPATPPVYTHTTKLVIKGRQTGYRVIGVYQRMSGPACGGIDAGVFRDQFPTKMLSRFGPQAVTTLTGLRPAQIDTSSINGRFALVSGRDVQYVQAPYGEPDELMAFALSGKAGECQDTSPPLPLPKPHQGERPARTGEGNGAVPLRRSLRDASADLGAGVVPMKYEALKKARQAGRGFPAGVATTTGTVYSDSELRSWYRARPSSTAGESPAG